MTESGEAVNRSESDGTVEQVPGSRQPVRPESARRNRVMVYLVCLVVAVATPVVGLLSYQLWFNRRAEDNRQWLVERGCLFHMRRGEVIGVEVWISPQSDGSYQMGEHRYSAANLDAVVRSTRIRLAQLGIEGPSVGFVIEGDQESLDRFTSFTTPGEYGLMSAPNTTFAQRKELLNPEN